MMANHVNRNNFDGNAESIITMSASSGYAGKVLNHGAVNAKGGSGSSASKALSC